jgi:tetratricopeptide (TPR) repeat protein
MRSLGQATRPVATVVAILATVLAICGWTTAAQPKRQDVNALLDLYARGDYDAAWKMAGETTRPQARALRSSLVSTGHSWVHAVPEDLPHRILAAAAFALEFEAMRAEKGEWGTFDGDQCAGRCAIEWACTILRARGDADDAERRWHRATFALVGGVRDWTFLLTPLTAPTPRSRVTVTGHVLHALSRLPADPHARLAKAIAIASRHLVSDEMDAPRPGERTHAAMPAFMPVSAPVLSSRVQVQFEYAKQQLAEVVGDPVVGPEARMRLGYLHWRSGQYEESIMAEKLAADATTDVSLRYNAYFIAAQAAQAAGDLTLAEVWYLKALDTRPASQSATLGLAALLFLRGDAGPAYDAIERSRVERPKDDDPWRLFLYGDYPRLPELIGQLRKSVTR